MARRREPTWLKHVVLDAVHFDQLREHGGLPGIRDENVLESALTRAKHRWLYEPNSDLASLSAAYGWGLATSHGYRDGNKRVAFLAMAIFLGLNGWRLEAPENEVVQVMLSVAAKRMSKRDLATWLRAHVVRVRSP